MNVLAHNLCRSFQLDTIAETKGISRKRTCTHLLNTIRTIRFLNLEFPRGEPSTIEGLPARVEYDRSGIDPELARILERSYQVRRNPDARPLAQSLSFLEEVERVGFSSLHFIALGNR